MIVEDDTKTKKGMKEEKPKKGGKEEKKKEEKKDEEEDEKEEEEVVLPGTEGRKAKCIFIEKYAIPLIAVKSDGGYNYDSTDLAAINYRLHTVKADRIIYITDSGQREHFEMIIAAAKKAGWLTTQRCDHMGFGVILGEDGKKFKTRAGKSVRLLDLLNEARDRALTQLKSREKATEVKEIEGEEK